MGAILPSEKRGRTSLLQVRHILQLPRSIGISGALWLKVISTLFQKPNEVTKMELPREQFYSDAGFTIVVARKIPVKERINEERRV